MHGYVIIFKFPIFIRVLYMFLICSIYNYIIHVCTFVLCVYY